MVTLTAKHMYTHSQSSNRKVSRAVWYRRPDQSGNTVPDRHDVLNDNSTLPDTPAPTTKTEQADNLQFNVYLSVRCSEKGVWPENVLMLCAVALKSSLFY